MAAIRVGMIGAGGIARRHLPAWLTLGAKVLVYSHRGAPSITAQFGGSVADSLDDLLEGSDLITVLTPTPSHHHYASTALRAGKDVVCEKPLTRHHQEAVELVRLAHQQSRHLFPAHVVRFRDTYAQMRSAVVQGRIGTPAVSRFTRTAPFPTWSPWFADYEQSGGPVLDVMVHDLDIARWVNGEVSQVYATMSDSVSTEMPISTAQALLQHTNGAISQVSTTWGPPGVQLATSFHISGTGGVLQHDSASEDSLRVNLRQGRTSLPAAATHPESDPFLSQLSEYLRAIRGGPPPRIAARDGLIAVDLALAAQESIQTGVPVTFQTWEDQ